MSKEQRKEEGEGESLLVPIYEAPPHLVNDSNQIPV